jgi:predicted Fe-Mo cluster-binding NifX family protein
MRVVVSAQGNTLDSATSPVFGRCPTFLFVDSERMEFETMPNPAMDQGAGAGIQAAQFVVTHGAEALLTGNLGPNAFAVLQAAGVPGYLVPRGTVREAVEAFKRGQLRPLADANVAAKAGAAGEVNPGATGVGTGMGSGWGHGRGRGRRCAHGIGLGGESLATPPAPGVETRPDPEGSGTHGDAPGKG